MSHRATPSVLRLYFSQLLEMAVALVFGHPDNFQPGTPTSSQKTPTVTISILFILRCKHTVLASSVWDSKTPGHLQASPQKMQPGHDITYDDIITIHNIHIHLSSPRRRPSRECIYVADLQKTCWPRASISKS
jgi:hypothetical protein